MSAITRLARDPSCLMAIDALNGARWLSPVKPGGCTALTHTNAVAADGVFRAIDNAKNKWVETTLNFSGIDVSGGITIAASIIPGTDENTESKKYHVFLDNGYMANNQSPIGMALDKKNQNSLTIMILDSNKVPIGQTVPLSTAPITLGAVNTVVYSYDAESNKRRIIINGFQQETSAPATHTMQLYNNSADTYAWTKNLTLFTANTSWRNPDDKVLSLTIWGKSMSMNEMMAITNIIGG